MHTARTDTITGSVIRGQPLSSGITFTDTQDWLDGVETDATLFLTAARNGFTLDYWTTSDGIKLDSNSMPNDKLTVYANWSTNDGSETYALRYHPNGGEGNIYTRTFVAGETLILESKLFKKEDADGYSALSLGWNTQADGTGYAYAENEIVTLGNSNVDLYIQWTRTNFPTSVIFSVTYHNNNGDEQDTLDVDANLEYSQSPREVKSCDDFSNIIIPTDKAFAGWSLNRNGSGTIFQAGDKVTLVDGGGDGPGVHLFAVWEDNVIVVNSEEQLRKAVQDTSGKFIRLGSRIVLTQNLTIANNVTIDLNGKSITGDSPTIQVNEGCTLTLRDSTATNGSDNGGSVIPEIESNGTLKVQDGVTVQIVKQGEKGSIVHTPCGDDYPVFNQIYVQTSSQLEYALSLTSSNYLYVRRVYMDKDITLANNATLPESMWLIPNGYTLSGTKTLTLANGSVIAYMGTGEIGCVTCPVIDNGVNIGPPIAVTVTFDSKLPSVTNPTAQTIIRGQKATEPAVSCAGFTFLHWSKQGETTAFDFDASILENTNLVAQWIILVSNEEELRNAVDNSHGYHIQLTDDISLTQGLTISANVTLDLNGHNLSGDENVTVVNGCTLSLQNSATTLSLLQQDTVTCMGTLKVQDNIHVLATVELGDNGSIDHTKCSDGAPKLSTIRVRNRSQLESVLNLVGGRGAYFSSVVLLDHIELENNVTLPARATLDLNSCALYGSKTLTLENGSTVIDSSQEKAGYAICPVDDKGATIRSEITVTVSFTTGMPNNAPAEQAILRGQKATVPTFSIDGYTLQHWSEWGETTAFDFDTAIMNDTRLMAHWKDYILVSNGEELELALEHETDKTIRLTDNIALPGDLVMDYDATIDLQTFSINSNGTYYLWVSDSNVTLTLYAQSDAECAIFLKNFGTLTGNATIQNGIKNNGTIENMPNGDQLTILGSMSNSGEIKGGVFKGVIENEGTISGGSFYDIVKNKGTIDPENDADAEFFANVINESGYHIFGGTFNASVENNGFIDGGSFVSKDGTVLNTENATIQGGKFECAVNNHENAYIMEGNGTKPAFYGTVTNDGYIYDGTFNQCTIINTASGEISGVTSEIVANGCTIKNGGTIWDGFDVVGTESVPSSLNNYGVLYGGQYDQHTEVTNSGTIEGGVYFGTVSETTESNIDSMACVSVFLDPGDNAIFDGEKELLILKGQSIANDRSTDKTPATPSYPDGLRACTGWSKQGETTLFNFSTPILEDITLVAQWTGATPVTSAQELKDALNSGAEGIVITKSFDIDETITIPAGKNVTLNALNDSQITGGTLEVSQGATLNANCDVDCNVVNKGTIENGSFSGTVTNEGTIENGDFTGDVTNESNGTVKHGFFRKLTNKGTVEDVQVDDTLTTAAP